MIGDNFFVLNSVESTNNYAMARVHAGLSVHGDTYFAHEQTAGKGQRGKSWLARPGENITMSVVLNTEALMSSRQFLLSASVALACHDLLTNKLGDEVKIKWPNDLYWRDRKAGGILIENQVTGTLWKYSVAGIGLNINQTSFGELARAVSFKQVTGKHWKPIDLAKELCQFLEGRWTDLHNKGIAVMEAYNRCLYKKDEQVKLKKENIAFNARIKGVNNDGLLVTESAGIQEFALGEIQWLI
jgi:BirA family transcriptional regulator, biotin operon repressor / biotin---[acetyl-CoA-carboxylase] ligase